MYSDELIQMYNRMIQIDPSKILGQHETLDWLHEIIAAKEKLCPLAEKYLALYNSYCRLWCETNSLDYGDSEEFKKMYSELEKSKDAAKRKIIAACITDDNLGYTEIANYIKKRAKECKDANSKRKWDYLACRLEYYNNFDTAFIDT